MSDTKPTKAQLRKQLDELRRQLEETRSVREASLQAETALWQGQMAFTALLNNLPGVAYRVETNAEGRGKAVFVSHGCGDLTGYPPTAFLADSHFYHEQVIHPDDRRQVLDDLFAALASGGNYAMTYRILTADGVMKWVSEKGTTVTDAAGHAVAREGFITDITGSLQPIQEILAGRQHLDTTPVRTPTAEGEASSSSPSPEHAPCLDIMETLVGGVAHDLNNVLQAVIGYAKLAGNSLSISSASADYLAKILAAADRAGALIDRLLSFCISEPVSIIPLRVAPLVEEARRTLRCNLPADVTITVAEIPERLSVLASESRLCQTLVTLGAALSRPLCRSGGTLTFRVGSVTFSSTNPPPTEHLTCGSYVFIELKANMEVSSGQREVGTAADIERLQWGIATARRLLADINGTVMIEGESIETIPTIYLPQTDAEAGTFCKQPEEDLMADLPRGEGHILFVDDEAMLVELGQLIAEELGYRVTVTTSSREALRLFEQHPDDFDVVITDQTMPSLTGSELAARLLAIRQDVPIILTTGYSEMVSELQARQMGVKEFLMKPITPEVLAETLQRVLTARKS